MWLILGHHYKPFRQDYFGFLFFDVLDDLEGQGHKCHSSTSHKLVTVKKKTTSDFDYIFDKIPQVHRMCYSVWFKSNFPLAPHYSNDGVDVLFYFILHVKRVFDFIFLNL